MLLSPVQKTTIDFMWQFYMENDQLPPAHVIAAHFKKTNNAAACVLAALEKKGFIEKNNVQKYRFTMLFHAEQSQEQGE